MSVGKVLAETFERVPLYNMRSILSTPAVQMSAEMMQRAICRKVPRNGLSGRTLSQSCPLHHCLGHKTFEERNRLEKSVRLCLPLDRPLSTSSTCHFVPARFGDEHAMVELTDVQLPKRVDDGGMGHPAVAMVHLSTGDARLPNKGAPVRPARDGAFFTVDADPFPRPTDKKLSACSIMASRTT